MRFSHGVVLPLVLPAAALTLAMGSALGQTPSFKPRRSRAGPLPGVLLSTPLSADGTTAAGFTLSATNRASA